LQRINYYRAMAGLQTIRNDETLSDGCSDHARYLLDNYGSIIKGGGVLGSAGHEEEPGKVDYTPDGAGCAGEGDIGFGCGDSVTGVGAVDGWMGTPFHRLAILDPSLEAAGFGSFESQGCWASALRLPSHAKFGAYAHPIEFPPNGSTVALSWPGGEWPSPLTGCPGYSEPIGLPITIQLGEGLFPNMTSHSLTENGALVEHCAYDAKGYSAPDQYMQEYARQVLHSLSAVVLIPRRPLVAGKTYAVSITANGQTYGWSFTGAAGSQ
jgi:Cysteine-rich secretory protein family